MAMPFLGAEELILLGVTESTLPMRSALRKVGALLRRIAEPAPTSNASGTDGMTSRPPTAPRPRRPRDGASRRASSRADAGALPGHRRRRRARRRPDRVRGLRRRRPADRVRPAVADRPLAHLEGPDPRLRPPPPRRRVGQPRQRSLGPPARPDRPHDPRPSRQPRRGDGRGRLGAAVLVGLSSSLRPDDRCSPPSIPSACSASCSSARPRRSASPVAPRDVRVRGPPAERRGLEQGEHPLLAARLRPTSSSSSARRSPSRTPPSRSRTASAGAWRPTRSRSRPRNRTPPTLRRSRRSRRCVPGSAPRRWSSRAPTSGSPTSARASASPARSRARAWS